MLVNVVTSPFKALGRLFSGGGGADKVEEPKVDPVTFAAGSAVLSPAMEEHLLRVADFLRRSPFVNLALSATPSPTDAAAAPRGARPSRPACASSSGNRAWTMRRRSPPTTARDSPDVTLPATVEEQVALLREREPVPDALVADLGHRRVEATRERLVTAEGIPPARLTAPSDAGAAASPAPATDSAAGEGRVEFTVVAGEYKSAAIGDARGHEGPRASSWTAVAEFLPVSAQRGP